MDFAAHDTRYKVNNGVSFVVSPIGTSRMTNLSYKWEDNMTMLEIGIDKSLPRFEPKGKDKLMAKLHFLMSVTDSLSLCKFLFYDGMTLSGVLNLVNEVTGADRINLSSAKYKAKTYR